MDLYRKISEIFKKEKNSGKSSIHSFKVARDTSEEELKKLPKGEMENASAKKMVELAEDVKSSEHHIVIIATEAKGQNEISMLANASTPYLLTMLIKLAQKEPHFSEALKLAAMFFEVNK